MSQQQIDPKFQHLLEQLQQQAPQLVDTFLASLADHAPVNLSSTSSSQPLKSPSPLQPTADPTSLPNPLAFAHESGPKPAFFPPAPSITNPEELATDLSDVSHIEFFQQLEFLNTFHSASNQSTTPIEIHTKLASITQTPSPAIFATISSDSKYLAIFDNKTFFLFYLDDIFPHLASSQLLHGNTQFTFHTTHRPNRFNPMQNKVQYTTPQGSLHPAQPKPINMWDLPSASFIPRAIKFHPIEDVLFVLCTNNTLLIYTRGHPVPLHIHDFDDISTFDIHPTGKFMLLASKETPLIKLYDLTTFTCSIPITTHAFCTAETPIQTKVVDAPQKSTMVDAAGKKHQTEISATPHNKYENDLPLIQSTQLPQFPIFAIKYSPFGQYFAVLCVSPQITNTTLPLIQVRVYSAVDHILCHTFEIPLQYHLHELSYLQHYNPLQNALSQPPLLPTGQLPFFDLEAIPACIEWSHNEQFLLVTTPFQPHFQLPHSNPPTTDQNTSQQFQPLTPSITAHLFRVQNAQLIFSYHIDSQFNHVYPNALKSHNISTKSNTPTLTNPNIPQNNSNPPPLTQTYPFTGHKVFFSPDSQYVFIAAECYFSGVNNDSLTTFTHTFQTSTGKLLKQVETAVEIPAATTIPLPAQLSGAFQQQQHFQNAADKSGDKRAHLLPVLQPYQGGMKFAPTCIIPDATAFRYFIFTMSGHAIAIDYQPVVIFPSHIDNDEDVFNTTQQPGQSAGNSTDETRNQNCAQDSSGSEAITPSQDTSLQQHVNAEPMQSAGNWQSMADDEIDG